MCVNFLLSILNKTYVMVCNGKNNGKSVSYKNTKVFIGFAFLYALISIYCVWHSSDNTGDYSAIRLILEEHSFKVFLW